MELPDGKPNTELIAFLDQGLQEAEDWWMVQAGVNAYTKSSGDAQSQWLEGVFGPGLTHDVDIGPRGNAIYLGSKDSFASVEDEVFLFLDAVTSECANALVRARIRHVLFSAKKGDVGAHIRGLAADYLEIGNRNWIRIHRVNALDWSLHFAKISGDENSIDLSVCALLAIIDESFNQETPEPGVTLHALEALSLHNFSMNELNPLLARARTTYLDSFNTAVTIEIQKRIAKGDASAILSLNRQRVQSLIDEGNTREPLAKHLFMKDAAQVAHKYGIWDLYDAAAKELQATDLDALGLVEIASTFTLEGEQLIKLREAADLQVDSVVGEPTLEDALKKLIGGIPPSGDFTQNEITAQAMVKQFPLQNLIRTTYLRTDGLPSYTASTPEDVTDEQLSKPEIMNMLSPLGLTGRILQTILDKFEPDLDELSTVLSRQPLVSEALARSIAKSLLAFRRGNFEESAAMVMPRIETLARKRLETIGELKYQVQVGNRRATLQQLGPMIADLKPHIPISWYRFLHTFLESKFGPNYRNELLHGYVENVGMTESSLTLLCALFMAFHA